MVEEGRARRKSRDFSLGQSAAAIGPSFIIDEFSTTAAL